MPAPTHPLIPPPSRLNPIFIPSSLAPGWLFEAIRAWIAAETGCKEEEGREEEEEEERRVAVESPRTSRSRRRRPLSGESWERREGGRTRREGGKYLCLI
jgi:hypothetical protein